MFLQFKKQGHIANQQARFNQVGRDAKIGQSFQQALFERAYAVADLELDIPQQRQQFAHLLRLLIGEFFAAENQQVDVGERVQLAAAIPPDRDQRQIADRTKAKINPQALEQLVDKFGARFD